jgi:hypothetical protein
LAHVFKIELPANWDDRWPEVQAAAHKYHFPVRRDGDDIVFEGYGIKGRIRVNGNSAHVTIDRKPFFLSKSLIEGKVRGFLAGQK